MRIGTGYDVHRLTENRALILGGITIPYERGLLGHSDADVLTHAIMDALLGAAALGDIGQHFPDTDPAYRGISSLLLLKQVGALLEEAHYFIDNIDATVIAQAPKLAPYLSDMRAAIAETLGLSITQVNVKATTEEGLGFTGSGEGIAAQAVCLLQGVTELDSLCVASHDDRIGSTDGISPAQDAGGCCAARTANASKTPSPCASCAQRAEGSRPCCMRQE